MGDISGRCLCGAVQYTAAGPVLWSGHCHCDSCRRASSAPFTSFFGVERKSVNWRGEMTGVETSDGDVNRLRCATCGTLMTIRSPRWPKECHLFAATLDHPETFQPQAHFHFAEKLSWVSITDDLPKYAASADTAEPMP